MKKILTILLIYFVTQSSWAEVVQIDNLLYYELDDSNFTAKVLRDQRSGISYSQNYNYLPSTITIPSIINYYGKPYTVTEITSGAFTYTRVLEEITIPNTVTIIGKTTKDDLQYIGAFYKTSNLKKIIFEDGEQTLNLGAYYHTSVSGLPPKGQFYGLPLEEVYLGRNIKNIDLDDTHTYDKNPEYYGYSAFYNLTTLNKVTIGPNVTEIPQYLFYACSSLTEITIPAGLKLIGQKAFSGCGLTKVMSNSLTPPEAETYAFENCYNSPLYVPAGSEELYKEAAEWKNFYKIEKIPVPMEAISLSHTSLVIYDEPVKITATISPENATDKDLEWSVDPQDIIGIEAIDGTTTEINIKPLSIGSCKLIAKSKDGSVISPACEIKVKKYIYANSINFDCEDKLTLLKNSLKDVNVRIEPADSDDELKFQSDNNAVVTPLKVQNNPLQFKLWSKSAGNAKITVTCGNVSKEIECIVLEYPEINLSTENDEKESNLNGNDIILNIDETLDLNVTLFPLPASSPTLSWNLGEGGEQIVEMRVESDDTYKVSFKGLTPGKTTYMVKSSENEAMYKTGNITVVQEKAQTVTIESNHINSCTHETSKLKVGEQLQLTSVVYPETADPNVIWSSSSEHVATIDSETGIVTALAVGKTTINATAKETSYVTGEFELKVVASLPGDANDSEKVNIADVMVISEYVVQNPVESFCHTNADADLDGKIDSNDITATVNIMLGKPSISSSFAMTTRSEVDDYLYVLPQADGMQVKTLSVCLGNLRHYTTLQADILLPEGMNVTQVVTGPRAQGHTLTYNITDEGILKIVLFSLSNAPFTEAEGSIFDIKVMGNDETTGLKISNIFASDPNAQQYELGFDSRGVEEGTTSVDDFNTVSNIKIVSGNGEVLIYNAEGKQVEIYRLDGRTVARFNVYNNPHRLFLTPGIYIFKEGDEVRKFNVK